MQKKLLGMAVATALTAPAVALAQVQVYGTANVTLNSTKYSDSTGGTGSVSKIAVNSHSIHSGCRWPPTTVSMTIFSGHGAARLVAV